MLYGRNTQKFGKLQSLTGPKCQSLIFRTVSKFARGLQSLQFLRVWQFCILCYFGSLATWQTAKFGEKKARLWEDGLLLHARPLARVAGWDLGQRRVQIEPGRTCTLGNGMDTTGRCSGRAQRGKLPNFGTGLCKLQTLQTFKLPFKISCKLLFGQTPNCPNFGETVS